MLRPPLPLLPPSTRLVLEGSGLAQRQLAALQAALLPLAGKRGCEGSPGSLDHHPTLDKWAQPTALQCGQGASCAQTRCEFDLTRHEAAVIEVIGNNVIVQLACKTGTHPHSSWPDTPGIDAVSTGAG